MKRLRTATEHGAPTDQEQTIFCLWPLENGLHWTALGLNASYQRYKYRTVQTWFYCNKLAAYFLPKYTYRLNSFHRLWSSDGKVKYRFAPSWYFMRLRFSQRWMLRLLYSGIWRRIVGRYVVAWWRNLLSTCSGCDGGRMFLRNAGTSMSDSMTSHFRRPYVATVISHALKNDLCKKKRLAMPKIWTVKKLISKEHQTLLDYKAYFPEGRKRTFSCIPSTVSRICSNSHRRLTKKCWTLPIFSHTDWLVTMCTSRKNINWPVRVSWNFVWEIFTQC
jgi:hypothetical protein